MACGFAVWFAVFSDCLASLGVLVVQWGEINRQDAKDAKILFLSPKSFTKNKKFDGSTKILDEQYSGLHLLKV